MNKLRKPSALVGAVALLMLAVMAVTVTAQGASGAAPAAAIDPADFSKTVDNPLFPISTFKTVSYMGEETDPDTGDTIETRVKFTVLQDAKTVAGVAVIVVRDDAFEDGELVESTLDYFAQHKDGSVYYFGEAVDNYVDGKLENHKGTWLAGEGENQPGIFMPANPRVGMVFEQERAPGIAEDRSTVLAVNETVTVPAGTFNGCIKTEDENPLDGLVENKWYCPGAGFVREATEDVLLELVSVESAAAPASAATAPALEPTALPRPTGVLAPNTGGGAAERDGRASLYAMIAGALGTAVVVFGAVRIIDARRARG